MHDLVAQKEQTERNRLAETLDTEVRRWSSGKEGNLRALLSTLQYILGSDSGWQPILLTNVITSAAVKKAYRKATLFVHPYKLQQRGASIQHKYICEKVFDLLKISCYPEASTEAGSVVLLFYRLCCMMDHKLPRDCFVKGVANVPNQVAIGPYLYSKVSNLSSPIIPNRIMLLQY